MLYERRIPTAFAGLAASKSSWKHRSAQVFSIFRPGSSICSEQKLGATKVNQILLEEIVALLTFITRVARFEKLFHGNKAQP